MANGTDPVVFGLDVSDYLPMCVPHAAQLDHGGTLTHCRRGHLRSPENQYASPNGTGGVRCLTCKKQTRAERNALRVQVTCPHCGLSLHEAGLSRHVKRKHGATP